MRKLKRYKDGEPKVKQRRGVRKNPDGKVSSHLMRVEYIPERGWVGFPSLFQDSKPYADDQQNWVDMSEEEDWMKIYEEAERRGEVYDFGEDKEAALAFGMGSWKDQLPEREPEEELYNMERARELGYERDGSGHLPSVDEETGMFLKSMDHPTAFKEYMYGQLNKDIGTNTRVVVNPEGHFGDKQLQYIELTDEEADKYRAGGYVLEELEEGGEDSDPPFGPKSKEEREKLYNYSTDQEAPNMILTYKDDKKFIDGISNWQTISSVPINDKFSDQIKARLYTGNYGYNPATGTLYNLNKLSGGKSKTSTIKDPDVLAYKKDLDATAGKSDKEVAQYYQNKEDALAEKYDKEWKSNTHPVLIDRADAWNPAFILKDKYGREYNTQNFAGQSVLMTDEEEAAYRKAMIQHNAPIAQQQMNTLFSIPASFTPAGLGIMGMHGAANLALKSGPEFVENPSWSNAGSAGLDLLMASPIVIPAGISAVKGVNNLRNVKLPYPKMDPNKVALTNYKSSNPDLAPFLPKPGLQIKSTMPGSPFEKQLSKTGEINVKNIQAHINKTDVSKQDKFILQKTLDENFVGQTKINYNDFKAAVSENLVPLLKTSTKEYAGMGIERLGYTPDAPLSNETILYSNVDEFGRGSFEHFSEPGVLGHSRTLVTMEEPKVMHFLESQSDWVQKGAKYKVDKYVDRTKKMLDSESRQIKVSKKYLEDIKEAYKKGEEFGNSKVHKWEINDVEKRIADREYKIKTLKTELKNPNQKDFLKSSFQERQLQENMLHAAEQGQTVMRYPTAETAVKIQGYTSELINTDKIQTILRKYRNTSKLVKKTLGVDVKIVNDAKGNSWYEWSIPKDFLQGTRPIRGLKKGGYIEAELGDVVDEATMKRLKKLGYTLKEV